MGAVAGGGGSLVCSHASCAGVNGSAGASASVDISPADDGERAREVIGGKGGVGVGSATADNQRRCAPSGDRQRCWRSLATRVVTRQPGRGRQRCLRSLELRATPSGGRGQK